MSEVLRMDRPERVKSVLGDLASVEAFLDDPTSSEMVGGNSDLLELGLNGAKKVMAGRELRGPTQFDEFVSETEQTWAHQSSALGEGRWRTGLLVPKTHAWRPPGQFRPTGPVFERPTHLPAPEPEPEPTVDELEDEDVLEAVATEALVLLVHRPAILVQDGRFFPAPPGWESLEEHRAQIETTLQSVGRIEVQGHPMIDWVGTGFVVGPDLVMTNRHVAEEFAVEGRQGEWRFHQARSASIDMAAELGTVIPKDFPVTDVRVHPDPTVDLSLLQVEFGEAQPRPLEVSAGGRPGVGERMYAVGYPAWDGKRNDPDAMRRVFTNIFGVKRLQPGEVVGYEGDWVMLHDCSTLGGNSGSCLVDLDTNQVIGLHFGGRYLEANKAVLLSAFARDPALAGINFN